MVWTRCCADRYAHKREGKRAAAWLPAARVVAAALFFVLALSAGLCVTFAVRQGINALGSTPAAQQRISFSARPAGLRQQALGKGLQATVGQGGEAEARRLQEAQRQGPAQNSNKQRASLGHEDFVVAVLTDRKHASFINSSRAWRKGIRTFVATNEARNASDATRLLADHNEVWGAYPDDAPLRTLALKGDSRAAMTPVLAHRAYGDSYKWMLYGDDDTFFFVDAAMNIVKDLDPDMPYFITDHLWWTERSYDEAGHHSDDTHHPHARAPVCVPCNYGGDTSQFSFPSPRGCPCTTDLLCHADARGQMHLSARGACGMPRVPIKTFSMHGGAGAILSVGLLLNISFPRFEECVATTYTTGGDALLSICLWDAGFGMTAPDPAWHPRNLSMFDVGSLAQDDFMEIVPRVAKVAGNLLQAAAGVCSAGICKLEVEHFATLHLRSRKFPGRAAHTEGVRMLAVLSDAAYGRVPALSEEEATDSQLAQGIQAIREYRNCNVGHGGISRAQHDTSHDAVTSPSATHLFATILDESVNQAAAAIASEIIHGIFIRLPRGSEAEEDGGTRKEAWE